MSFETLNAEQGLRLKKKKSSNPRRLDLKLGWSLDLLAQQSTH